MQQHFIYIVPRGSDLATAFHERLTPPFADAQTEAEVSVLQNVRMAYQFADQGPIAAGSSGEAGAVTVLRSAAHSLAGAPIRVDEPFRAARSLNLRDLDTEHDDHPGYALLEEPNDFNVGVFPLREALPELARAVGDEAAARLAFERSHDAVIVAVTQYLDDDIALLEESFEEWKSDNAGQVGHGTD